VESYYMAFLRRTADAGGLAGRLATWHSLPCPLSSKHAWPTRSTVRGVT
jgi:hypothetical protein